MTSNMYSEKRINENEKNEILRICNCDDIQGVKIEWEKAEEIAVMLGEVERMNKFKWLKDKNELLDLNGWINTLRFYQVELYSMQQHNRRNDLAQHARHIAEDTIKNAITQEDREQGTREMNAAAALGRGDIDTAFRSLDYFRDR
jgi:hypothetical protein